MTIQEYLDLINDWDSAVPMSTTIKLSKALRKVISNYPEYNEDSEFTKELLKKFKETFIKENGDGDWVEAADFVVSFIGQIED